MMYAIYVENGNLYNKNVSANYEAMEGEVIVSHVPTLEDYEEHFPLEKEAYVSRLMIQALEVEQSKPRRVRESVLGVEATIESHSFNFHELYSGCSVQFHEGPDGEPFMQYVEHQIVALRSKL